MTHTDLREKFASFWEKRGHSEIPPIPLVLENDPTTLFNGSGMQQLVPYLLGEEHPLGNRLYNIQRSFRSQDIEEVGDNRHTTFFEMMGNWSLGDYFKEEQLAWFWEFLTKEVGLPKDKLWVTVFEGNKDVPKDTESIDIWKKIGISKDHIRAYPASKNWWSRVGEPENMPPGEVGGPDSEVFYEFTDVAHDKRFGNVCHPNCDCGRFLEIGNSVFIQYKKTKNGLEELPKKNVDFGGGLERILAAQSNDPDVFYTDVFTSMIYSIEVLAGKKYNEDLQSSQSFRVIADHLRAAVMLIADGVSPSNKDQGYVLRRLIRRSIRYARNLDLGNGFTKELGMSAIEIFKKTYPHVSDNQNTILQELSREEEKFRTTLERGLKEFKKLTEKKKEINGKDAFYLYESFGFPLELTEEIAREQDIAVDLKEFEQEKKRHTKASRKGATKKFKGGLADASEQTVNLHTATHLLHQALRDVLGDHVQQKGSNITADRLRFDFSHDSKLRNDEIVKLEEIVNQKIQEDLPVTKEIMSYEGAIRKGALAFFGERYPEKVAVYAIGNFSKEICGGPHVENTRQLGTFKISKESSAGAGIRRVYAILS